MTRFLATRKYAALAIACLTLLFISVNHSFSQTAPNLGSAGTYGVFTGDGAISNTGLTVVTGDIGTNVGSFTGFPPGRYTGAKHVADAATLAAKNDLTTAYNSMLDATNAVLYDTAISATMGNGQVLTSRTYGRSDLTTISGNLTFDAKGNSAAIFIIKIRAALDVAAKTKILLVNGAQAANIYWAVNGAVSILDSSVFKGTIIANGAIHFYTGSSLEGRALSVVGAITLASSIMSLPGDNLVVITPAANDSIKGGTQNYKITWGGNGIASQKTFDYSLDSGATWKLIGTVTGDVFTYNWNVPDTTAKKAMVRITDANNLRGVSGAFTITSSKIIVIKPALGDSIKGGTQNYQITWSGVGLAPKKTLEYSLDSGATWKLIDSISSDAFSYNWNLPDTAAAKAMIRITDKNGITGKSGAFMIKSSKITVLKPAVGDSIKGGMQNYQITWSGVGLAPQKTLEYSLDGGLTWKTIGTVTGDVFSYSWNVPDTVSTQAIVRITDQNGVTGKSVVFTVKSSKIIVIKPALGDGIKGGTQNYQITWSGVGLAPQKTFEYSLDGGLTWTTIGTITADVFTFSWNVPDTGSTQAVVRITDKNGIAGASGVFTISSSKITVVKPSLGESIIGGTQNYQITWTGVGLAPEKTIELSTDGGATWEKIGTMSSDLLTFSWNVPDIAAAKANIRITDKNGITGTSRDFVIKSSQPDPGTILVINPAGGSVITGGTQNYQITWTGVGLTPQKTIELSTDGGLTWETIGTITADVFSYSWDVPDTVSTNAIIRITDQNGVTGESGVFTIKSSKPEPGSIIVIRPAVGEVIDGGMQNYLITFTATNTTPHKVLEYSLDGGTNWSLIGLMNSNAQSFSWANVPNVATTQALVRIVDANGVIGVSGLFTIKMTPGVGSIDALTLSGLDSKNTIGNNKPLEISWAYTPDIGTSVEVEYSLDYTATWHHVATVAVSASPYTTWITPMTGSYNPVFIRVTSSMGMTRTSAPFRISTVASVSSDASKNGYSVSNYPNPAGNQTTVSVVLPVSSDVTLTIVDALGRVVGTIASQNYDAGTHNILLNTSDLRAGMYAYIVQAGTTNLVGRMSIVK